MNNYPQQVTERYVSNLLRDGQNNEFSIKSIARNENVVEEIHTGFYYKIYVEPVQNGYAAGYYGIAPTPASALRRALEKFGVTFR